MSNIYTAGAIIISLCLTLLSAGVNAQKISEEATKYVVKSTTTLRADRGGIYLTSKSEGTEEVTSGPYDIDDFIPEHYGLIKRFRKMENRKETIRGTEITATEYFGTHLKYLKIENKRYKLKGEFTDETYQFEIDKCNINFDFSKIFE